MNQLQILSANRLPRPTKPQQEEILLIDTFSYYNIFCTRKIPLNNNKQILYKIDRKIPQLLLLESPNWIILSVESIIPNTKSERSFVSPLLLLSSPSQSTKESYCSRPSLLKKIISFGRFEFFAVHTNIPW